MNIVSFKHKGLEAFYTTGSNKGIKVEHAKKLKLIFNAIELAQEVESLNISAFCLHPLKGDRQGTWSITVRANWRITFAVKGSECQLLDYEDYH